jgi:hypothetical protein
LAGGQQKREGIHPAVATAAALATVVGTVIAVLAFVVGAFDDDSGKSDQESTSATAPVIESLAYEPPSGIDATGVSGPVSEGKAIYLVARRPNNGEFVASTTAKLSESTQTDDQLRWRALLDLNTTSLAYGVKSDDQPVPYEVVAAVLPKARSSPSDSSSGSPYADSFSDSSADASDGPDLDAAEALSAPRLITVP